MVDITMCIYKECPLSSSCYRFLAKAEDYQSYFIIDEEERKEISQSKKCLEYWKVNSKEEVNRLNRALQGY